MKISRPQTSLKTPTSPPLSAAEILLKGVIYDQNQCSTTLLWWTPELTADVITSWKQQRSVCTQTIRQKIQWKLVLKDVTCFMVSSHAPTLKRKVKQQPITWKRIFQLLQETNKQLFLGYEPLCDWTATFVITMLQIRVIQLQIQWKTGNLAGSRLMSSWSAAGNAKFWTNTKTNYVSPCFSFKYHNALIANQTHWFGIWIQQ